MKDGIDPNAIIISIIGLVGSLGVAYITYVLAKRKSQAKPNPIEVIVQAYDKLILQQQNEIDRKQQTIDRLQLAVERFEKELQAAQDLLSEMRRDLHGAQMRYDELREQLKELRSGAIKKVKDS